MKTKGIFKVLIILFVSTIIFGCNSEKTLKEQGNDLVKKIEAFKDENGYLPERLSDIGIEEKMEGPLFYRKWDSVNYTVWYGTDVGESMTYYSDTKEWDYRLRGMGKDK